jgi:hypothetical protein
MKYLSILLILFSAACSTPKQDIQNKEVTRYQAANKLPFNPRTYVCYHTSGDINVDGLADDEDWSKVPWSSIFEDIEGPAKPQPTHDTRVKMLWDKNYLYIFAELMEPHVWATLTQRDAVIFQDNDFEVFIDPDGDNHGYFEYEVNAFNTVWDLILIKPYRDGGPAIINWDINGLKSAVKVHGTINDPSDTDEKWCVEIAFPMNALTEYNKWHVAADGVQWRINFSRVQWNTLIVDGQYKKKINPDTGRPYPENNWVWSPQGVIDMHRPETWGFLQFTDKKAGNDNIEFVNNPEEDVRWELMQIYYAQRSYRSKHGSYSSDLKTLVPHGLDVEQCHYFYDMETTPSLFEARATLPNSGVMWHINNESRLWKSGQKQ